MKDIYILKRFQKEIKRFDSKEAALEWLYYNAAGDGHYCFTHGYGLYVIRDEEEIKIYGW